LPFAMVAMVGGLFPAVFERFGFLASPLPALLPGQSSAIRIGTLPLPADLPLFLSTGLFSVTSGGRTCNNAGSHF
jgi:hypothetical protein